ncbi:MAG: hypothetical protein Q9206_003252 [Seirophora lacunosa]|nr:MAG: hypothetical protein LQ344_001637 [Seirophora lacunosa]
MEGQNDASLPRLPFPSINRSHILHCSYHSWHPKYRSITPKARLIPLDAPFLSYLRSDGIILPPEPNDNEYFSTDTDSGIFSSASSPTGSPSDTDSESSYTDPSLLWPEIHTKIKSTIEELGGNVVPKLNWSAPKDATWINATNNMECRSPNDVYLLLKSSDFITHDLEQAFAGCSAALPSPSQPPNNDNIPDSHQQPEIFADDGGHRNNNNEEIPYHLILRKTIPALATSLEFRCFVRARALLCLCQRDLNHYDFLADSVGPLRVQIQRFFDEHLKRTFEDADFVFDVYVPPPHRRVWLIDINPWAPRTDPLLFSWLEILRMRGQGSPELGGDDGAGGDDEEGDPRGGRSCNGSDEEGQDDVEEEEEEVFTPEFRLVGRNDPEAYSFNTPQYGAHKMPKDVVDASGDGEAGLREFMGRWREIVREQEEER